MIGRFSSYTFLVLFALLASGLYLVKYEVQALKDHNDALQVQLEEERMALHLLQAEWSYLNRPSRLLDLAEKRLDLVPMQPQHIVSFTDIPLHEQVVADAVQEAR